MSGATGGGLGALVMSRAREEYPDRMIATFSVVPYDKDKLEHHTIVSVSDPSHRRGSLNRNLRRPSLAVQHTPLFTSPEQHRRCHILHQQSSRADLL